MSRDALRKQWIKALRSGEYTQTKNCLKNDRGFCALGVLCDIVSKRDNVSWKEVSSGTGSYYEFEGEDLILPRKLMKEVGLRLTEDDAVSELNDAEGKTFSEIADIIEQDKLSEYWDSMVAETEKNLSKKTAIQ
jgi:hypothetical protein